jgi:hypothetical protein
MRLPGVAVTLAAAAIALPLSAGEVVGALIQLETFTPFHDVQWSEAAPVRFALLPDGTVFVGGSAVVFEGRLDKREIKDLERAANAVRKLKGLGPEVRWGGDAERRYVLRLGGKKPLALEVRGEPGRAPAAQRALAALVTRLEEFIHPSLRFHRTTAFWVRGREQALPGGCKPWTLPLPMEQVTGAGAGATWEQLRDWPHGADPASVCHDGRRYAVWFKPLLPGEQP